MCARYYLLWSHFHVDETGSPPCASRMKRTMLFVCIQETEFGRRASFVWCNLLCDFIEQQRRDARLDHNTASSNLQSRTSSTRQDVRTLSPSALRMSAGLMEAFATSSHADATRLPSQHLCATMLLLLSLSIFSSASNSSSCPVALVLLLFCCVFVFCFKCALKTLLV